MIRPADLPGDDRPNVYTRPAAAARIGVTLRTIEEWHAKGWLVPIEGSKAKLGYWLYTGPALAHAERAAKRGRSLRAATRRRKSLHYPT